MASDAGRVVWCSNEAEWAELLGKSEEWTAWYLRLFGCTFTDLDDRTLVRVARGYRSRDTSVPYVSPRKPHARAAKPGPAPVPRRNATLDSMSAKPDNALIRDPSIPF